MSRFRAAEAGASGAVERMVRFFMARVIVGISEVAISDSGRDELVTHSLGSCLGVSMYDHALKIGGLLHCMLPLSSTDRRRAESNPALFVDTGVAALLGQLLRRGCARNNLVTKVAGGACMPDHQDLFRIGERNYIVLRRILWKSGLLIAAEDVGGAMTRSVRLEMSSGRLLVRRGLEEKEL